MLTVLSVKEAQRCILESLARKCSGVENIPVAASIGRVTAEESVALETIPPFNRSTMDGFAVRSADTFGASESMPALLNLAGHVLMGAAPPGDLQSGEAMSIPTGGMLPAGSDSVVMVEYSEIFGDQVALYRPAAPFENTIRSGEDFQKGDTVIPAGRMIRAADVGILSALGRLDLKVYAQPRVNIFSTGDEIVAPGEEPKPGQIRDINGPVLLSLAEESGGVAQHGGIIADEEEELQKALLASLDTADLLIISGGSSVGTRDVAARVIAALPAGGVYFHGVSMRPGKPLIYGMSRGKPIFGLSGNPVSAIFSFILFVRPALRVLQGLPPFPGFTPYVEACLDTNISSPGGREDYVRVALYQDTAAEGKEGMIRAKPFFGGPGLLHTMVQADGYFVIPRDVEGYPTGSKVKVYLF